MTPNQMLKAVHKLGMTSDPSLILHPSRELEIHQSLVHLNTIYFKRLAQLIGHRMLNITDGEDAVQLANATAIESWQTYNPAAGSFLMWWAALACAARTKVQRFYQNDKAVNLELALNEPDLRNDPVLYAEVMRVFQLMGQATPEMQEVLYDVFVEGRSYREVAELRGINHMMVARICVSFSDRLKAYEGGSR